MTKQEAIKAMKKGEKVAHKYFGVGEFITYYNGKLTDETGLPLDENYFWKCRPQKWWEIDWEIFNRSNSQFN